MEILKELQLKLLKVEPRQEHKKEFEKKLLKREQQIQKHKHYLGIQYPNATIKWKHGDVEIKIPYTQRKHIAVSLYFSADFPLLVPDIRYFHDNPEFVYEFSADDLRKSWAEAPKQSRFPGFVHKIKNKQMEYEMREHFSKFSSTVQDWVTTLSETAKTDPNMNFFLYYDPHSQMVEFQLEYHAEVNFRAVPLTFYWRLARNQWGKFQKPEKTFHPDEIWKRDFERYCSGGMGNQLASYISNSFNRYESSCQKVLTFLSFIKNFLENREKEREQRLREQRESKSTLMELREKLYKIILESSHYVHTQTGWKREDDGKIKLYFVISIRDTSARIFYIATFETNKIWQYAVTLDSYDNKAPNYVKPKWEREKKVFHGRWVVEDDKRFETEFRRFCMKVSNEHKAMFIQSHPKSKKEKSESEQSSQRNSQNIQSQKVEKATAGKAAQVENGRHESHENVMQKKRKPEADLHLQPKKKKRRTVSVEAVSVEIPDDSNSFLMSSQQKPQQVITYSSSQSKAKPYLLTSAEKQKKRKQELDNEDNPRKKKQNENVPLGFSREKPTIKDTIWGRIEGVKENENGKKEKKKKNTENSCTDKRRNSKELAAIFGKVPEIKSEKKKTKRFFREF